MATDQPVKKRQRIDAPDIEDGSDRSAEEGLADIYESATSTDTDTRNGESPDSGRLSEDAVDCAATILPINNHAPIPSTPSSSQEDQFITELRLIQNIVTTQCMCQIDNDLVIKVFNRRLDITSWPTNYSLSCLSTVQLVFDVYLKQNNAGTICSNLMRTCDIFIRNQNDWLTEVTALSDHRNKYLTYTSSKLLATFLILAKDSFNIDWLKHIVENVYLFNHINRITIQKINFTLDVIKRVLEWKDIPQHPLEDTVQEDNPFRSTVGYGTQNTARDGSSSSSRSNGETTLTPRDQSSSPEPRMRLERVMETGCVTVVLTDSESFDSTQIKCLIIKTIERHWPLLLRNMKLLVQRYLNLENSENCVTTFISVWENVISVRANLSILDTKPFYADLQGFVELLRNSALPGYIYGHLLSLFNEVLCYGSTLALQDMMPDEICNLAHTVVRYVKDYRLLNIDRARNNRNLFSFIGEDCRLLRDYNLSRHDQDNVMSKEIDKTLLQRMSLLVLKSIAITVKEMQCDSSDSSLDSSDYGLVQDMQIVERSIRDVIKKLEAYIRSALPFHPETSFAKILVHLFSEQDDYLVEAMVCTLDITVGIVNKDSVYPDWMPMLNPISSFIEFLKIVSFDHDVLLDLLVSNETCFLLYLLRILKYVRRNWAMLVGTAAECGPRGLDDTMAALIRLRLQISRLVAKSLFPYSISPVLRLLEHCESLYEGNELS